MALPMLVGGADCGPVNPLQGLTKTFDQDRGTQQASIDLHVTSPANSLRPSKQDQFGGRAGPSRQVRLLNGSLMRINR
jgi:peroxin-5